LLGSELVTPTINISVGTNGGDRRSAAWRGQHEARVRAGQQAAAAAAANSAASTSQPSANSWRNDLSLLWQSAREHADSGDSAPFLQHHRLQHDATHRIEQHRFNQLHAQSSDRRKALLTACSAPHAAAFLSTLPTQPSYRVEGEALRLALRHRLGLLPFDSLATQCCSCRFATSFARNPDHFMSCEKFRRTQLTTRHNNVVQVLLDLAQHAGYTAIREPIHHVRPPGVAEQDPLSERYSQHADLLLLRHATRLYIDVAVLRPTAESKLKLRATLDTLLASTRQVETAKHSKYAAIAKANGYCFSAFALETYGGRQRAAAGAAAASAGAARALPALSRARARAARSDAATGATRQHDRAGARHGRPAGRL
jgi:hypothetical protein